MESPDFGFQEFGVTYLDESKDEVMEGLECFVVICWITLLTVEP